MYGRQLQATKSLRMLQNVQEKLDHVILDMPPLAYVRTAQQIVSATTGTAHAPVQWRRLHTTEHGGTCPPPTFTNGWARGQWRSQRRCGGGYRPLWPQNLFLVSRFSRIKRIVHYAVHLRQMNEWRRCRYIVSPFSKLPDPPLTGGTVSRRTANNKLIKPYWPPWKRSPKRLIVLVEPKKWRGTTTEIFFRPDVCPPHYFKIRSGATGAVAWNKLAPESRRGFATEIPTVFKKRLKRPHLDRRFKYSDHVS